MARLSDLLPWVEVLTGLPPDRVLDSIEVIRSWELKQLESRLEPRDVDSAVRAVLLAESVARLEAHGVPRTKLLSKLRDIGQFAATWAELRCASLLVDTADDDATAEMEPGKARGAQPDLRLVLPGSARQESIEIKAVGLSDDEVAFCRRVAPALERMIPRHGMVTLHSSLDSPTPRWSAANAAATRQQAARAAARTPRYPAGLSAATIVAHDTEASYIRRVAARLVQAIRQLPSEDECWVGVFWSNGAAIDDVATAIDWSTMPAHIVGVVFVGSLVIFPHREINNFRVVVQRGYDPRSDSTQFESTLDDAFAEAIFERTETSSGVRAILVRGMIRGRPRVLLRRDGSERIAPFNLLLDRDPAPLRRSRIRQLNGD